MSSSQNPYAPPQVPVEKPPVIGPPAAPGPYAPCPKCGHHEADKQTFTWWGGLVGPALLTHVQCRRCRRTFNGKTGKPNDTAIAIYVGVCLVIGVGLAIVLGIAGAL